MLSKKRVVITIASALIGSPLMAADNPASHLHGQANLQLAFNDNRVDLLFESPAGNLLGFEHEPRTTEQQQTLDRVTSWLKATPLINTSESTCTVEAANVQRLGHDDGHAHAHTHTHGEEEHHADIEVTQVLVCSGLKQAASLVTPISTRFSGVEHLNIEWVGPDGQGATRLESGDQLFKLGR
ncbi:ZrgA family zinc uptake protein [Marinobacter salexigens]|uniref:DUF2796 domain-containing protein n=1 Tax=Marinobacter salexigens TaxID=1925763 RepID=A0ABS6A5K0_9GAMM|nr:DUF2796 domain-containing protein [Marinobacter salexigens]MBU2872965.1 DUF2796 domain-containing protein [Marinobacter salexigens]